MKSVIFTSCQHRLYPGLSSWAGLIDAVNNFTLALRNDRLLNDHFFKHEKGLWFQLDTPSEIDRKIRQIPPQNCPPLSVKKDCAGLLWEWLNQSLPKGFADNMAMLQTQCTLTWLLAALHIDEMNSLNYVRSITNAGDSKFPLWGCNLVIMIYEFWIIFLQSLDLLWLSLSAS